MHDNWQPIWNVFEVAHIVLYRQTHWWLRTDGNYRMDLETMDHFHKGSRQFYWGDADCIIDFALWMITWTHCLWFWPLKWHKPLSLYKLKSVYFLVYSQVYLGLITISVCPESDWIWWQFSHTMMWRLVIFMLNRILFVLT